MLVRDSIVNEWSGPIGTLKFQRKLKRENICPFILVSRNMTNLTLFLLAFGDYKPRLFGRIQDLIVIMSHSTSSHISSKDTHFEMYTIYNDGFGENKISLYKETFKIISSMSFPVVQGNHLVIKSFHGRSIMSTSQ